MIFKRQHLAFLRAGVLTTLACLALPVLVVWLVPDRVFDQYRSAIWVIGAFGIWRYGWFLLNTLRGGWFNGIRYPKLRKACAQLPPEKRHPEQLDIIVLSYKEDSVTSGECFRALVRALDPITSRKTVIVSVATQEEADLIALKVEEACPKAPIDLRFTQQAHGKRYAIGHALRFLRRYRPETRDDAVLLLMDGDSVLGPEMIEKCLPHFQRDSGLGAITTNEALESSPRWATGEWFRLKFAKRHFYMSSHSLSHRVLTLTGRGSFVRTPIALSDEFIRLLENDSIQHPVHGHIPFLLGDDKSTLFCVLKDQWRMLYVPDAWVYAREDRTEGFFKLSTTLMGRWYGNMLRNNYRCLALGPTKMPFYIWICFLDQRISMWTGLVGPVSAVLATIFKSVFILPLYLGWVTVVRLFQLWIFSGGKLRMSPVMVPMQLFDQIVGSLIKIYGLFHLSDQEWSKGGESSKLSHGDPRVLRHSRYAFVATVTLFVVFLLILLGVVPTPFHY